jgi:acyl dehydratase
MTASLDDYFEIGVTVPLGSHTFDAESIRAFARKYDPQPFHVDGEEAKKSLFGALCASGWQTAATWMKRNLATPVKPWPGPGPAPEFGPSPGITDMKWLKPVYAGETVSYSRTAVSHRPMASRPGWRVLTVRAEGFDSTGDKVIEFESAVLVKVA